jgi:hypothetical protein
LARRLSKNCKPSTYLKHHPVTVQDGRRSRTLAVDDVDLRAYDGEITACMLCVTDQERATKRIIVSEMTLTVDGDLVTVHSTLLGTPYVAALSQALPRAIAVMMSD